MPEPVRNGLAVDLNPSRQMLEQVGQALGSDGGLERAAGPDVSGDQRQLTLGRGSEPPGAPADQRVEAPTARSRRWTAWASGPAAFAVFVEHDDLCHATNDSAGV